MFVGHFVSDIVENMSRSLVVAFLAPIYLLSFLTPAAQTKNISAIDDGTEIEENSFLENSADNGMKLVCYYGSWAVYRPGRGKFPVEEIDPFLCSHLIYGFAGLSYDNKIRPLDPYNDLKENWGKGAFLRFTGLKKINPKLKTMIAIGGWNEGSVKYSNMAANPESRKVFVQSVVEFLERYDFDGLDMDWEYPGSRGGKPEDKRNLVLLLKELKEAFRPKNYILSSAVAAGKHFMDPAYDVPQISKYLDMINVMCYDYHGSWETKTGHHAPLYGRPNDPEDAMLNVNFSINYWISKGAPREKLVLGMGTYGRAFTLRRAEDHGIGSPAPQKGQAGPYTREGGSLGYNEICEMKMKNPKIQTEWEPYYMAPYSYWDRQWVGYDDIKSIAIKARYAKAMRLAGGMIWSIETDDFGGHCGDGKYPLLNAIKRVLDSPEPATMPAPDPSNVPSTEGTTRPSSSTTPSSPPPISSRPPPLPSIRPPPPPPPSRPSWPWPPITTSRKPSTTSTTTTTTSTTTRMTTTRSTSPTTTTTSRCTKKSSTPLPFPSTTTTKRSSTTDEAPSSTQKPSSGWWSSTKPWWPTKPSHGATASSEVWWSSTFPSDKKNSDSPNSINVEETTPKPPVPEKKKEFICRDDGLFRDPELCTKFIRCVKTEIEGQFQLFFYECPDKTVFNNVTKLCDWAENVPECIASVPQYFLRGNIQNNFQEKK